MRSFSVELECFHGPLDLLLYLVRRHEVDVLEVGLASLAGAYLEYLDVLTEIDIDEVGDFLVVASTLMELKSRTLLPRTEDVDADGDGEDATRRELVRHLLEYKRFKEAGALLWERAQVQRAKLPRLASDLEFARTDPANQSIRELELWDLVSAFSRIMRESVVPVSDGIERDPTPISVYMQRLEGIVLRTGGTHLATLFGKRNTKPQIIGKFLALLELVKLGRVWIELAADAEEIMVLPPRSGTPPAAGTLTDEHGEPPQRASAMDASDGINATRRPHYASSDPPPGTVAAADTDAGVWEAHASPEPEVPGGSAWDDFQPIADDPTTSSQDAPPSPDDSGNDE